jgi:uncharacterized membrane protein YedE/YeeE
VGGGAVNGCAYNADASSVVTLHRWRLGWLWYCAWLGLHQWAWRMRFRATLATFFACNIDLYAGRLCHRLLRKLRKFFGIFMNATPTKHSPTKHKPTAKAAIYSRYSAYTAVLYAGASGAVFALGLVLSGMTNPAKVIGFLNLGGLQNGVSWTAQAGFWDPSLALVMGGALLVTLLAFATTPKRKKPWAAEVFELPKQTRPDAKLLMGAALFGIGWGLVGYCPGPAIASLLTGGLDAILFTAAMAVGMFCGKTLLKHNRSAD